MKRITKQMIEDGLNQNIIKPCQIDEELAVTIGDNYFFIGYCTEYREVEPNNIPQDVLVNLIQDALNEFYYIEEFFDEYLYYYYYLMENINR